MMSRLSRLAAGLFLVGCKTQETHEAALLAWPELTILDVDGADAVLTLVRDRDPRSPGAVRVALVDPEGGVARWSAGGFLLAEEKPAVDLERLGETVVVAALDGVHAYDLRTGATRWSTPVTPRTKDVRVCADDDAAARVRVSSGDGTPPVVLDLATGKLLPHHTRSASAPCPRRPYPFDAAGLGTTSFGDRGHRFHWTATFREEGQVSTVGWKEYDAPPDGGPRRPSDGLWLQTWTDGERVLDVRLPFEAGTEATKAIKHGHASRVLYSAVTTAEGDRHLHATRSTTGERVWSAPLGRSPSDVHVRGVLPRRDVVYVRSLEELAVVDARTGATRTRLRTLTLSVEGPRRGVLPARHRLAPADRAPLHDGTPGPDDERRSLP